MYRNDPCIVLTQDGANKIAGAETTGGLVIMRRAPSEAMYVVAAIEVKKGMRVSVDIPREYVALNWGDPLHEAHWMRSPVPRLNVEHLILRRRPSAILNFDAFREMVPGVRDPGSNSGLLITHDPDLSADALEAGAAEFAGWHVDRSGVRPIHIEVEPSVIGLEQLRGKWPIDELAGNSVMLVGCGSLGSAAAEALAAYGIGRVELVDPDRFWWHNMLRHTLGPESVGRLKVQALKSHLERRWPDQVFGAHAQDFVDEAHYMRPLVRSVDLVLCTADGIAPRRVVSHIARRAGRTAVLACVLDRGAVGEVLRLRPTPRFGCLLCQRQHLATLGAMDAEADQELDYGTGYVHQPMTAVPPDLRYVGTLAAKIAVATLLESIHGDHTQRLPGELAILGLQPSGDLAPPFNLREAGLVTWSSIPPPRATCPTCAAA
jgi:hypothetical protein